MTLILFGYVTKSDRILDKSFIVGPVSGAKGPE